jgi:hypothetical protein
VYLARDSGNRYSAHAIEVRLAKGLQIGYMPDDFAEEAAPFLDRGCPHQAFIPRILVNTPFPIPIVQAYLYRPDATAEGLVFPADVPGKRSLPAKPQRTRRRSAAVEEAVDFNRGRTPRGKPAAKGTGCLLLLPVLAIPVAVLGARAVGLM